MSDLTANLKKAEAALARFRREGVLNHIGGESRLSASGAQFETLSPVDGSTLAQVAKGGAEDIDAAVRSAQAAFAATRRLAAKCAGEA